MRKIPYNEKKRNKCEYCTEFRDGSCKWQECHYEPEQKRCKGYPAQAMFVRAAI
jgi:hypothetical protein